MLHERRRFHVHDVGNEPVPADGLYRVRRGDNLAAIARRFSVSQSDLVALNTKDGSEAWRVRISPGHGTAMHARLGEVDVAIHPPC